MYILGYVWDSITFMDTNMNVNWLFWFINTLWIFNRYEKSYSQEVWHSLCGDDLSCSCLRINSAGMKPIEKVCREGTNSTVSRNVWNVLVHIFLKILFLCYMYGLFAFCLCAICRQCPQRPEKILCQILWNWCYSWLLAVMSMWELNPGLQEQPVLLPELSLQPPIHIFNLIIVFPEYIWNGSPSPQVAMWNYPHLWTHFLCHINCKQSKTASFTHLPCPC